MSTIFAKVVWASCILVLATSFVQAADVLPNIAANDNRTPAGMLQNGVLAIRLEIGEGRWHPESEDGEALTVYAFGEAGKSLQIPGPLIRVSQGTEIRATVHNSLSVAATVHGLNEHPGDEKDGLTLEAGATRDVTFKPRAAGTYHYWATTTRSSLEGRTPVDTQLGGAFVVDPPGAVANDRIFVISIWYNAAVFRAGIPQVAAINGKSWPYAERLTFQRGETVRWRWVNLSPSEHAMHLHGFYYHLEGTGDGEHYRSYAEVERPMMVTRLVEVGETFDMSWVPDRVGRWLFHCHMLIHMSPTPWRALKESQDAPRPMLSAIPFPHFEPDMHGDSTHSGMGGLVVAVTVVDGEKASKPAAEGAERSLKLTISETGVRPGYAIDLQDPARPATASVGSEPARLIGPPIVLTRGQSVAIEVANRTKEPTAIHWHGIELESYYDGVPGWTGMTEQTTPAIEPGKSFVARMTPPRAGTFIYHTHWHDPAQLGNGIYGPLIVLPAGQEFDVATDKIFLVSVGVFEPFGNTLLVNGRPQPIPLQLALGKKYRFRLINIEPNQARTRVSLRKAGVPVQWRLIAKDGADLPPSAAVTQTAEMPLTVGETYDVEYEAAVPQDLVLEFLLPGLKTRVSQGLTFGKYQPSK